MISFVLNVEKVKHFVESFFSKIFYFLYLQLPLPPPPPELYPSTIKPLDPRLIAALGTLFHFKLRTVIVLLSQLLQNLHTSKAFYYLMFTQTTCQKKKSLQIKWKKIFSPETLCQGKQKNIIYNNILQTKFNLRTLFQNWKMLLKKLCNVKKKLKWLFQNLSRSNRKEE